jgi:hypothetical protein
VTGRYAEELIDAGFAVEVADAPLLHDGLNVADLVHVLVLHERAVVPEAAVRRLLGVRSGVPSRSGWSEPDPGGPADTAAHHGRGDALRATLRTLWPLTRSRWGCRA